MALRLRFASFRAVWSVMLTRLFSTTSFRILQKGQLVRATTTSELQTSTYLVRGRTTRRSTKLFTCCATASARNDNYWYAWSDPALPLPLQTKTPTCIGNTNLETLVSAEYSSILCLQLSSAPYNEAGSQ